MSMARAGGALCVLVSAALLAYLAAIGELEATPLGVLSLAAVAGLVALARPQRMGALMAADLLLVVALLPAVFGWVPLLYLPSLALLVAATVRAAREEGAKES